MRDRRLRSEIEQEFQAHIELAAHHHRRLGLAEHEAQEVANQRFGDRTRLRDEVLAEHTPTVIRMASRFARVLVLAIPLAALIAAVTLILGLQFRMPLTYRATGTSVSIWQTDVDTAADHTSLSTLGEYDAVRKRMDLFTSVTAARYESHVVSGPFPSRIGRIKRVTPDYLADIGVTPMAGTDVSVFDSADRTVLLTHQSWVDWFGGNDNILGDSIRVGHVAHRISGVLPKGVEFFYKTDLVAPLSFAQEAEFTSRRLLLAGQLAPGVSVQDANAKLRQQVTSPPLLVSSQRAYNRPFVGKAYVLAVVAAVLAFAGISAAIGGTRSRSRESLFQITAPYHIVEPMVGIAAALFISPAFISWAATAMAGDSAAVFDFSASATPPIVSFAIMTLGFAVADIVFRRKNRIRLTMRD